MTKNGKSIRKVRQKATLEGVSVDLYAMAYKNIIEKIFEKVLTKTQ